MDTLTRTQAAQLEVRRITLHVYGKQIEELQNNLAKGRKELYEEVSKVITTAYSERKHLNDSLSKVKTYMGAIDQLIKSISEEIFEAKYKLSQLSSYRTEVFRWSRNGQADSIENLLSLRIEIDKMIKEKKRRLEELYESAYKEFGLFEEKNEDLREAVKNANNNIEVIYRIMGGTTRTI